ncbi:MAG: DPP IV N-terminal domain-containing protein, partial [Pyrinomonadaceae bacterium]
SIDITRLTNNGKVVLSAISPDGRYVAYVMDEKARQQSLHIKQVATLSDVEIVPPAAAGYWSLTFSPDNNYVLYVKPVNELLGELYQVATLGGPSRKLLSDIDPQISFSPDGKRFAFVRSNQAEGALMLANANGTEIKKLAVREPPESFSAPGMAWSPDGKVIACSITSPNGDSRYKVIGIDVEHGTEVMISSQKWKNVDQLAWLSDGSGLIMTASEDDEYGALQVWQIFYPGSKVRRLITDFDDYRSLSVSADSHTVAAVQIEQRDNLWFAPGNDATQTRQLTPGAGKYPVWRNFSWTPDGQIIYSSKASGNWDIWIMNADGSNQRQLTVDTNQDFGPVVTPDGNHIVFVSERAGAPQLWRMEKDGSNQKQLTDGEADIFPNVTLDGKWVVYQKRVSNGRIISKVSLEGGAPVPLTDKLSLRTAVSPDGKLLACIYWSNQGEPAQFAVLPIEGGPPIKLFDVPSTVQVFPSTTQIPTTLQWTPDGRALAYIDTSDGVSNIWRQPIAGGPPTQLTRFNSELIFHFEWSRDGKQLALARGTVSSDVVLIRDQKDQR